MTAFDISTNKPIVYFIQSCKHGPVKIGVTNDVNRRMSELQTGNSVKIELVGYIPCNSKPEAMALEKELHTALAPNRMIGEWFGYIGFKKVLRARKDIIFIGKSMYTQTELAYIISGNKAPKFKPEPKTAKLHNPKKRVLWCDNALANVIQSFKQKNKKRIKRYIKKNGGIDNLVSELYQRTIPLGSSIPSQECMYDFYESSVCELPWDRINVGINRCLCCHWAYANEDFIYAEFRSLGIVICNGLLDGNRLDDQRVSYVELHAMIDRMHRKRIKKAA